MKPCSSIFPLSHLSPSTLPPPPTHSTPAQPPFRRAPPQRQVLRSQRTLSQSILRLVLHPGGAPSKAET